MVPAEKLPEFPHVVEYAPDCKDFTLHQIKIPAAIGKNPLPPFELPPLDCGSIVVLVEGAAQLEDCDMPNPMKKAHRSTGVNRGDIVYIPPNHRMQFDFVTRAILAYRTFSYEEGPDHSARNIAAPIVAQHSALNTEQVKTATPMMKRMSKPVMATRRLIEQQRSSSRIPVCTGRDEIFDVETEMDGFM